MKKILIALTTFTVILSSLILFTPKEEKICYLPIETDQKHEYIGKVSASGATVRLLVLKHCFESMADGDAKLAIEAANLAKTQGLNISDIGNFYINREGQAKRLVYDTKFYADGLKDFISKQMKNNAQGQDTLVIFTIGHGANQGYLQSLGQRADIFKIMAEAAHENNQQTIWWQLSCYASARLPKVDSLTDQQQNLFSVVASSDANTESPAYEEGKIMEKVFVALAKHDKALDQDNNEMITAQELRAFLNNYKRGRGDLVYAKSPEKVLFGLGWARLLPIIDHNNPKKDYPKDYIQYPGESIPIPKYYESPKTNR